MNPEQAYQANPPPAGYPPPVGFPPPGASGYAPPAGFPPAGFPPAGYPSCGWLPPPGQLPPPPPGWAEYRDPSGRPYWHQAATGHSAWEHPGHPPQAYPPAYLPAYLPPPQQQQLESPGPGSAPIPDWPPGAAPQGPGPGLGWPPEGVRAGVGAGVAPSSVAAFPAPGAPPTGHYASMPAISFAAAGSFSESFDAGGASSSHGGGEQRLNEAACSPASGWPPSTSFAAAGQALGGGMLGGAVCLEFEEDTWVRAAEAHFSAIAPPSSLLTGQTNGTKDGAVAAMEAHAAMLAQDGNFEEEMEAARAACHWDADPLPPNFKDPIPERHKERLKRALAKNLEYVLTKDLEARRQALESMMPSYDRQQASHGYGGMGFGRAPQGHGGLGSETAPRGPSHSGRGTGGAQQSSAVSGPLGVNTTAYVSGLGPNVTWASLDLVFGAHGRVRKIKIYRGDAGQPLGDALVTFVKPGSVALACSKLSGSEVPGLGGPLTVQVADFSKKQKLDAQAEANLASSKSSGGDGGEQGGGEKREEGDAGFEGCPGLEFADEDFDEDGVPLFRPLPASCQAADWPTCVLRNLYTAADLLTGGNQESGGQGGERRFLDELEAEILLEAVRYGAVKSVLTLPDLPYYFGAALVTFEQVEAAQACGEVMDGRSFAEGFISVQALGNWGEGEITPAQQQPNQEAAPEAAPEAAGPVPDNLDDFLNSV
mmetsp:Transcript_49444/g.112214  ORF Transcript_49444/g.112214 Transcript_49444/m.112214 type:complete len:709 (+) Transcript_49444:130-2256(+)